METLAVDGANGDAHEAVRVAVKVALVVDRAAVSAREDKDGPLALATVLDAVDHGLDDEPAWSLHRLAVIRRSPRARIDVVRLVAVVERRGFVGVRDGGGQDPDAGDASAVGNTDSADIVLDCGDLACAAGPVQVIGEPRFRKGGVVVVVP